MTAPAWTTEQDALIWQWAGLEPSERIGERCSQAGPPRNDAAVRSRAWQLGISLKKRRRRTYERSGWQPEEEAVIRDLAGHVPVAEITARLNARFGTRRRAGGVQRRAALLGVSTHVEGLMTANEVRMILGIGWARLTGLLRSGQLEAARRSVAPGGEWGIAPAALRAFIAAHPDLIRWQEMAPGPWREYARSAALRSSWLTTTEYQRHTRIGWGTIHRQLAAGEIPGAQRVGRRWLIPRGSAISPIRPNAPRPRALVERLLAALGPTFRRCVDLARDLGTSESGIYVAVKTLRRDGHPVELRYGQGYRLRQQARGTEVAS